MGVGLDLNTFVLLLLVAAVCVLIFRHRRSSIVPPDNQADLFRQISELRRDLADADARSRTELQNRMDTLNGQIVRGMSESSSMLQKQFVHTSTIIKDVTERLTTLDQTNKQVLNFSGQLQSLENILKNPKQRGILGEYWLETLLGQVLQPTQYKMQYDLGIDEDTGNKLIPDSVIFIREMLIPIDAKFSLENYNRIGQENDPARREVLEREFKADVKKRIDETSKYIRPERGTTNFAFMFVPAEGVYHNLIGSSVGAVQVNARSLIEYAF